MKRITSHRTGIAYVDEGAGPPVVLAHCSSASHAMWRPLMDMLAPYHRVLAPDFIGYGASAGWHGERVFELRDEARVLLDLAAIAGEPVHYVGHSYGGAVTLEALRMSGGMARAVTLIEPVSFFLLKADGRSKEWETFLRLVDDVQRHLLAGEPAAAVSAYMGFWLGAKNWDMTPEKTKAAVLATIDKVNSEFQASKQLAGRSFDELATLARVPMLLIQGELSPHPAKAVIEILSDRLPAARIETVTGAGHMSPMTHRDEINGLIRAHVADCAAGQANQS